jgi:hypothetical protein
VAASFAIDGDGDDGGGDGTACGKCPPSETADPRRRRRERERCISRGPSGLGGRGSWRRKGEAGTCKCPSSSEDGNDLASSFSSSYASRGGYPRPLDPLARVAAGYPVASWTRKKDDAARAALARQQTPVGVVVVERQQHSRGSVHEHDGRFGESRHDSVPPTRDLLV